VKQFLFGSPVNPTRIEECTHTDLIKLANESEEELLLFASAGSVPETAMLEQAAEEFRRQPYTTFLVLQTDDLEYLQLWDDESALLASLVDSPLRHGALLFSKTKLLSLPENKKITNAVWWSFVQFVQQNAPLGAMMDAKPNRKIPLSLPALAPRAPKRELNWVSETISQAQLEELVPGFRSSIDAEAVRSGLLQLHDFLDDSHSVCQSYEGEGLHVACDYWHGIMHRREPDVSNSKYWFRRVGNHPQFPELARKAAGIFEEFGTNSDWASRVASGGNWDAYAFVDFCAECRDSGDLELTRIAEEIQLAEMRMLMRYSLADARQSH